VEKEQPPSINTVLRTAIGNRIWTILRHHPGILFSFPRSSRTTRNGPIPAPWRLHSTNHTRVFWTQPRWIGSPTDPSRPVNPPPTR
jgi:hypothetical protein